MGQCQAPTVSTASEVSVNEMLVNIKVAPQMGAAEETAWDVRVERGATVAALKQQICDLYEVPLELQVVKRTVDGPVLLDDEQLVFDQDVAFHLSMANPLESLMQALSGGFAGSDGLAGTPGGNPMESLMQAMAASGAGHGQPNSGANGENPLNALMQAMAAGGTGIGQPNIGGTGGNPMEALMQAMAASGAGGGHPNPGTAGGSFGGGFADVLANMQSMQEGLANTTYTLKFVMPAKEGRKPEKRCTLDVVASSTVSDVLDMVKLELNAENENLLLEFCGQVLPGGALVQLVGLGDGDTVMVVPAPAN